MIGRVVLSYLLLLMVAQVPPSWGQNPFMAPAEQDRAAVVENRAPPKFSFLLSRLNLLQREFREQMTGYARQIQESPAGTTTLQFLGFTFVFGVVHALGPGHGKSIVCSYFVARRGTIRQALFFGHLLTFLHVLSATVIVLSLAWLGKRTNLFAFQEIEGGMQTFSYLLIVIIGAILLFAAVREVVARRDRPEENCAKAESRGMLALALSAGLLPCPGAALILLFTLSLDILWAGLLAMLVLAAGMGLTNSLVGVTTVGSRQAIMRLTGNSPRLFRFTYSLLAISGSIGIVFLGTALLLGQI